MSQNSDSNISILAVGDISPGDSPKMLSIGVRDSTRRRGCDFLFSSLRQLPKSDLIFGNLEGVLSETGFKRNSFSCGQLRGLPSMAVALKNAGFNVLNVANNHIMQYGPQVFLETLELLKAAGINYVGVKGEDGWFCQPLRLEIKGKKIGFLGYANPDSYGFEPLFALSNVSDILVDVERLKQEVDLLIVSLHWGDEFIRSPSPSQREIAHTILDSGCSLILGHHPHVIQSIEKTTEGWICYSLGNFVSDMVWNSRTLEGLAVVFVFSENGVGLEKVNHVSISRNYVPSLLSSSLVEIGKVTACDETVSKYQPNYRKLVSYLYRKNSYLGHLNLLRTFYRYNLKAYLQIWLNSILSFLKN